MTPADHCDITVIGGAPAIRLRTHDTDLVYPLTPSEAAALVRRLAAGLEQLHQPRHDRTNESLAHPDNHTLRHVKDPAA